MNHISTAKKLIQINTVCNNSTGHIMHDIQVSATLVGYETLSIVGRRKPYSDVPCVKYGNIVSFWTHVFIAMIFDKQGWGSFFSTRKMVGRIREENPDIIHLHNIHGYYLNLPILFHYLCNEYQGKLFWTFHDCWPFTGHCPHYVAANCNKWKDKCFACPNKKLYPISLFLDASESNYKWKKRTFNQLKDLTILVPSQWLYTQVKESFFGRYRINIVKNGIDQSIFYPRDYGEIISRYQLEGKKIILGVANIWDKRKGLGDFIRIAAAVDINYVIILVGLTKRQCKQMPDNIIGIQRTEDAHELAKLYSAADVFVNPSCEESFSLVTVEAMSCGTPVIVRNGSATEELVGDQCGKILQSSAVEIYLEAIKEITTKTISRNKIVEHARMFSKQNMTSKVMDNYACME